MTGTVGVVLIHGAGLDASIWEPTIAGLYSPSLAVDFPNRGAGAKTSLLGLNDYVESAARQIEQWDQERFILVAHSIGGLVGLRLAERFGSRVAGFIGVGCAVPPRGGSFLTCLPFPKNLIMRLIIRFAGTEPPASVIIRSLCNDLSQEQARNVVDRFTPESPALYRDPINVPLPAVPRLYVMLNRDNEFPAALQHRMKDRLNADSAVLDSGHLPMLSKPAELAELINSFAAKLSQS